MAIDSIAQRRRPVIWDVFCRVVDNHGDAGVCWRLTADLASRGIEVRLWIDDARALAWMAPGGCKGVTVHPWPAGDDELRDACSASASVVIEAFGCGLPDPYLSFMASLQPSDLTPLWINLEYLSAEAYVERNHQLPSLQRSGAGRGLTAHFFYPGFTERTGGLLRERDLVARRNGFRRDTWLAERAITPLPGERLVSLFCYANPELPALMNALAQRPTLLLTTPGHATEQVERVMAEAAGHSHCWDLLRIHPLPWLSHAGYDELLWSCDLNFVRGEDSLVRAVWAGAPFIWQIYPQDDDAHHIKLDAFLSRAFHDRSSSAADSVCKVWACWNRGQHRDDWQSTEAWSVLNCDESMLIWRERCAAWRDELFMHPDLVTQLLAFANARRFAVAAKISGF
jgi:uncharacterized repeat protein (TIGR03837 family)